MIRKSIDNIRATDKQKNDIYERICADYEKNEKTAKKTRIDFLKYGTMAAATVLALGGVAVAVSLIVNMQGVPVTHTESGGIAENIASALQSDTDQNGINKPRRSLAVGVVFCFIL